MDVGVTIFATESTMDLGELAVEAEARGFESLFVPEHTHVPVTRETDFPGGGGLPDHYARLLDPFVALTRAAAATTSLKVGTAVCLVIQHDPILLAKTVATLDVVSNGRFVFGIGGGWSAEEMRNHGTDPAHRWQVMRERVEAMTALWRDEEPEYHGEFVHFDRLRMWPKPLQTPRPPVLVGGWAPGSVERAIDYGDGWMPANVLMRDPDFFTRLEQFRRRAEERGRPDLPVSCYSASPTEEFFERLREAGVERAILGLPSAGADEVLPVLDAGARLIASG
jgi:probable F420-dependent oxidoreductase